MKIIHKSIVVLSLLITVSSAINKLYAQLNPFGSSYFQNRYINNPAYAGINTGLDINGVFKQQFSSLPGAPQMQNVSLENGFDGKSGLGLMFNNDKAGVLRYTTVNLAYAYHIQLDEADKKLSFGLSLGLGNYDLDMSRVKGDMDDIDLISVNQRKTYFDGGFGFAYTSSGLNIEAAIPNIKQVLKKDIYNTVDFSLFYSALSYRFETDFGSLEPRAAFRGIHGYKNILDAGLNIQFFPYADKQPLNLLAIYHTTNSVTFGAGVKILPNFGVNVMYTTNTSDLKGYNNGDFEIGIKVSPFVKRRY